ncbi:hypothetical protein ACLMJK_004860 [Lecanora helva]
MDFPNLAHYVKVYIDARPTTGNREMFLANLPMNADIHQLYNDLKLVVDIHIAGTGARQESGGLWKYQLLSHDLKHVVNKRSVALKTDDDYGALLEKIKGKNKETPIAILTQEKIQSPMEPSNSGESSEARTWNEREAGTENNFEDFEFKSRSKHQEESDLVWGDLSWDEPLDEDGNPYFDPIDPAQFDRIYLHNAQNLEGPIENRDELEKMHLRHAASNASRGPGNSM